MASSIDHGEEIADDVSLEESSPVSSNSTSQVENQSNEDSPWLSKARRPEPLSSTLNSSIVCTSTPVIRNNTLTPIKICTESQFISLKKLRLGLESKHMWKLIHDICNVSSDYDVVSLDDFVNIVKHFFKMDLDAKGKICEMMSDSTEDTEYKLKLLEEENAKLREKLQMVEEERIARCETEKELFKIRQIIQTLINDKRRMEARLTEQGDKKNSFSKNEETQTEENITTETELKTLEQTCELYRISTQKLLEFTKNVQEILTNRKKIALLTNGSTQSVEKSESCRTQKPITVKRAASVQNSNGDVANYFVDKYGNGGRVCRTASACTVANRQNKNKCTNEVQNDILERMALKAKEITDTIEAVLNEDAATTLPRRVHWV